MEYIFFKSFLDMQLIQKINGDLENWKATKLNILCLTKNQRTQLKRLSSNSKGNEAES